MMESSKASSAAAPAVTALPATASTARTTAAINSTRPTTGVPPPPFPQCTTTANAGVEIEDLNGQSAAVTSESPAVEAEGQPNVEGSGKRTPSSSTARIKDTAGVNVVKAKLPDITTTTASAEKVGEKSRASAHERSTVGSVSADVLRTTTSVTASDGVVVKDVPKSEARTVKKVPQSKGRASHAKDASSSSEARRKISPESVPTSSSGGEEASANINTPAEEGRPPGGTPPPFVESSTASVEKRSKVKESSHSLNRAAACPVDSSSSSRSLRDAGNLSGRSSSCSDNVNSITTGCSSSSGKEESHQDPAASGPCTNRHANAKNNTSIERARSSPSPAAWEINVAAVIEDRERGSGEDPNDGVVIQQMREVMKPQSESFTATEPKRSSLQQPHKTKSNPNAAKGGSYDRLKETDLSTNLRRQANEDESSVGSSTSGITHASEEKKCVIQPAENRESATVPPEPDPGPSNQHKERRAVVTKDTGVSRKCDNVSSNSSIGSSSKKNNMLNEPAQEDASGDSGDTVTIGSINSAITGGGNSSARENDYQQSPTTPTSRNPLQFTDVANDEVELKVDGGHLLDRVIKLSLLKGLQDSGKRLAKSSLIISGAGANGEGSNGGATLATTSSLSKAKNAVGLRHVEEHKTTPPALVAPAVPVMNGTTETGGDTVREIASSTKEVVDYRPPRVRHSSETVSSPSGEIEDTRQNTGGVRSSSNSSLDFREEGRLSTVAPAESVAPPLDVTYGKDAPQCREPVGSSDHLPVKARKPQYYASIPDFTKQNISTSVPNSTSPVGQPSASSTSPQKTLTQLHMKTPDFSCLGVVSSTGNSSIRPLATVVVSQSSPGSSTAMTTSSTTSSTCVRATSELKISNPDFSKVALATSQHPYPVPAGQLEQQSTGSYPLPNDTLVSSGSTSPFVSQDTFSKLIKERNYIADLQLKNPPRSVGGGGSDKEASYSTVLQGPQNDVRKRSAVVDSTPSSSGEVQKSSSYEHCAESSSHSSYQHPQIDNAMDLEPQAHVIHKNPGQSQPVSSVPKTWNPPEFSSTHFTQPSPSLASTRHAPPNGCASGGPSSTSPSPRDPSPSSSSLSISPHQGAGPQPYPGGKPSTAGPSVERIIVNNVRTYYPEQAILPTVAPAPMAGNSSRQISSNSAQQQYPALPKVKDLEFRLDHSKEQLLLQEGTIITVKQPYPNHVMPPSSTRTQQHPAPARSPSAERREAQMLQNSQDILYRDYRQHKRPASVGNSRPTVAPHGQVGIPPGAAGSSGPQQGPPGDRRSSYDPSSYYQPMLPYRPQMHPQSGPGLMHPPPPNWPAGQNPSSQRSGVVSRNTPLDNGASPVSSPAAPPGASTPSTNHHYNLHHHQHGQYKNSPSPVSGSAYGSASSPTQPMAAVKYPTQPHPIGSINTDRRPEVERDPYTKVDVPGYYKGLDFNMEQKFAEVYQAHQAKEKQAAEASVSSGPAGRAPRASSSSTGSPGVSSASSSGVSGPSKPPYGAYDPYQPYYQHSQGTLSPTSTPSPVPSPHHRKYSGPPSRDPSPLGQQSQQQPQQHRYGANETLCMPPGGAPSVFLHSGSPKHNSGTSGLHEPKATTMSTSSAQPAPGEPYNPRTLSATSTYPLPSSYAGAGQSVSSNPSQQSVISNAYDRYQPPHPYASTSPQSTQGPPHNTKLLPYLPARQQATQQQFGVGQVGPNGGPANDTSAYYPHSPAFAQSATIHPPVSGKNIPVRVIATAPPAAVPANGSSHDNSSSSNYRVSGDTVAPPNGQAGSSYSITPPTSQVVVARAAAAEAVGQGGSNVDGSTAAVIVAPTKRESPLDLSVKTVKTKADSTGCDDYGSVSASNSSISSSSSSTSSNGSGSGGTGTTMPTRSREIVPKVDFNPNFNKHIPPSSQRSGNSSGASASVGALVATARPQDAQPASQARHVSVISPAIPPGYDKKTDAYMSANYRAVGGPLVSPVYQYGPFPSRGSPVVNDTAGSSASSSMRATSSKPGDPYTHQKQSTAGQSGSAASGAGSATSKSVYYPPTAGQPGIVNPQHPLGVDYMRSGKPIGGSIVTGQAPAIVGSSGRSNTIAPSSGHVSSATTSPATLPARVDDPRIEDRKFVESMLKKKTSPSSDVIADLQSGRFPTRLPPTQVPKKRAAAAAAAFAAAAAAAEAAHSKTGGASSGSAVPTPAKMAKYEDSATPQHNQETASGGGGGGQSGGAGMGHYDKHHQQHPQTVPREGLLPPSSNPASHYGTAENPAHYATSKRPVGAEMMGPSVHPSVITTNYHNQPPGTLQHQHQYPPDMRYYQHPVPQSKSRDEPLTPVYHQPHLRGGSSIPYGHGYHPYHQQQADSQHHLGAYHQHRDHTGQPLFRHGEPPKSIPEHPNFVQMHSHIHYTGPMPVAGAGSGADHKDYPQQQQLPHHQQQGLASQQAKTLPPATVEPPGGMARSPYVPPHHLPYGVMAGPGQPPQQHPQHRGADQSVISKLRTSLELKEYEKQRINQLRKQPAGAGAGPVEEATVLSNIPATPVTPDAPLSSARFRTKGELKGYTPLPISSVVDVSVPKGDEEHSTASGKSTGEAKKEKLGDPDCAPPTDTFGAPPMLHLLDWESACNEFVEQLQTGKKRGRRKRPATESAGVAGGWHNLGQEPGEGMTVGEGSSDLSAVPKDVLNSVRSPQQRGINKTNHSGSVSSSDEDKPLLLLRQQSQQQKEQEQQQQTRQQVQEQVDSQTRNILLSTVEKLTDKLARNIREKQRLELEQKHEAKLGRSSSTDSDTARLASAAAQRAKAHVRKLRKRSSVVPSSGLKSSDGDGDVTMDGEELAKAAGTVTKRTLHPLPNAAKRKRDERGSSPGSSSSENEPPAKPEVVRRKRGRPKGSLGGAKRAQQATMTRCQASTLKPDPNENSDLSSDDEDESKAIRTPPTKSERNSTAGGHRTVGSESVKKRGEGGTGGTSGGGNGSGGKVQQVKAEHSASRTDGKGKHASGAKKCTDRETSRRSIDSKEDPAALNGRKFVKPRTMSRSKTLAPENSSSSSSSSHSSSSSSSSEEEDRETMTRSKSKREAERRRSNSKVLRNDKIVENRSAAAYQRRGRIENERTPTKKSCKTRGSIGERETSSTGKRPKPLESDSDPSAVVGKSGGPRKRTRQASKNVPSSSAESDQNSSSDEEGAQAAAAAGTVELTERLRSRKSKNTSEPTGGAARASKAASTKSVHSRRESTSTKSGKEESSTKRKLDLFGSSSCSSGGGRVKKPPNELHGPSGAGSSRAAGDHFYPGWEKELYEYKRSLKVPPELITIGGGLYMHRISTSLPDLDSPHHSDGSETFSEIVKKIHQKEGGSDGTPPAARRIKTKAATKQQPTITSKTASKNGRGKSDHLQLLQEQEQRKKIDDNEKFSSIIELLHRRCVAAAFLHQGKSSGAAAPAAGTGKQKACSKGAKSNGNNNNNNNNIDEIDVKPKQEYELLPTPGAESESLFAKNSKKKKSLFDTAILKSRTRTEQKAMQSKEMIREVFGGDGERPQSAPPLGCGGIFEESIKNVTYDEKYNELMRNVDRIVGELDGGGVVPGVKQEPPDLEVEEDEAADEDNEEEQEDGVEDDDETQDSVLMKESERDTPSVASERDLLGGTPLSFKGIGVASTAGPVATGASTIGPTTSNGGMPEKKRRGRGHRASRRKGSSGFDYIRKKKKPSQQHHNSHHHGRHRGFDGTFSSVNSVRGGFGFTFPRRKTTAFENLEVKDESHISKEIRSWVLNKGVGESVMHKAARLGYTDVIVYCLERLDMDPDLKDNAGYTPLHEACAKGHLDIAHYLLQYGASHSEPAPSGMRPLHEAVENSFIEIVRLLLAFGADPMLATYAGLTPMQLAESDNMTIFLQDHLCDVQSMAPNKTGWKFDGSWKIHDPEECGCNVFSNMPGFTGEGSAPTSLNSSGRSSIGSGGTISSSGKHCDSNSNIMHFEVESINVQKGSPTVTKEPAQDPETQRKNGLTTGDTTDVTIGPQSYATVVSGGCAGLRNGKVKRESRKDPDLTPVMETLRSTGLLNGSAKGTAGVNRSKLINGISVENGNATDEDQDLDLADESNVDGMVFEYEESDRPLPPLYMLKDEHNERWVLMSDLCHVLKFKSKEAVLRQICPNNTANNQRDLIREMKIEEFLARANCLQLLCAGEKLNIHASKVVLVKYNDSVKNLLQVKSVMTRI